jgi:hypothetical protein
MNLKGLFIQFEADPDMEQKVPGFMASLTSFSRQVKNKAWYAFHDKSRKYGIFMVADGEQILAGEIQEAIMKESGKLFKAFPEVTIVDILEYKLPAKQADEDTKALLLTFKAKEEHEQKVEEFLADARSFAIRENDTTAWFAFRLPNGEYGIFDSFPHKSGRFRHLLGRIPRELAKHAFSLLGSFPDLDLLDILEEKLEQSDLQLTV